MSNIKHRNTLGCLDRYTCRGLRLWNSPECEAVYISTFRRGRPWNRWIAWTNYKLRIVYNFTLMLKFDLEDHGQLLDRQRERQTDGQTDTKRHRWMAGWPENQQTVPNIYTVLHSQENATKTQFWPVSLHQNGIKIRRQINRPWP